MRTVIVAEMLRLLKLTNVELKGSHAFINGTLGQYTVHLGSAVVREMRLGEWGEELCFGIFTYIQFDYFPVVLVLRWGFDDRVLKNWDKWFVNTCHTHTGRCIWGKGINGNYFAYADSGRFVCGVVLPSAY